MDSSTLVPHSVASASVADPLVPTPALTKVTHAADLLDFGLAASQP